MKIPRLIVVTGIAAVMAFAGLAAWKAWSKHTTENTRRLLATQRLKLETTFHLWESEEKAARTLLAAAESASGQLKTSAPAPVAETPPPVPAISYVEWMRDPKVQVLALAHARAELATSYGPFFRAQKLSPAQVEKLRDVLIRHKAFTDDISVVAAEKNLSSKDPAIQAQREVATAELRTGVNEVLGPAGYEELKSYQRALPVRTFVGKVAGAATLAGQPMSLSQVEALTDVIAQSDPQYAAGGPASLQRIDWKTAEAQARAILAPEQMNFFKSSSSGSENRRFSTDLSAAMFRAIGDLRPQLEQISR